MSGRIVEPGYPGDDSSQLPWNVELVDGQWLRRERPPAAQPIDRVVPVDQWAALDVQLLPRPRTAIDVVACVLVVLGVVMAWALLLGAVWLVLYLAP